MSSTNQDSIAFQDEFLIFNEYKKALDKIAIVSKTDSKGIITYVNNKFCEISGYSKKELLGKTHAIVKSEDTSNEVFHKIWKTIAVEKKEWVGKLKNKRKNGSEYIVQSTIIPLLESEKVVSYIAIRYDITEMEKHRFLNQLILDNQKEIILVGNINDKITNANKSFFKHLDIGSIQEFNKKYIKCSDLIQNKEELDQEKLKRLDSLKDVEIHSVKINETNKTYKINFKKLSKTEFMITLNDITKMTTLINKAQQESFMKSNFLATMSHEIRTPLNGIIPYIDLLQETAITDKQNEYLQIIKSSSETLLGVINDILDLSKIESGKLEIESSKFDVFSELENLVDIYSAKTIENNIALHVFIDPLLPKYLIGDILRIKQIVNNLLSNAIKFTKAYGMVFFSIDNICFMDDHKVCIGISVEDTGIGISKEKQKKMFKPFSQADSNITRSFGGTGLGLSISQNLANLLGGKIQLKSEENKGSKFYLDLKLDYIDDKKEDRRYYIDNKTLNSTNIAICTGDSNLAKEHGFSIAKYIKRFGFPYDMLVNPTKASSYDIVYAIDLSDQSLGWIKYNNDNGSKIIVVTKSKERISCKFNFHEIVPLPLNPSKVYNSLISKKDGMTCDFKINKVSKEEIYYKATVLIADDNEINRKIIEALLHKLHINTIFAVNGKAAVEIFNEKHKELDLIFMDVHMPIMDGIEATKIIDKHIKERNLSPVPIVGLSADAIKSHQEKYIQCGMSDFIAKPIETDKLYKKLENFLAHKKATEEEIEKIKEVKKIEAKKIKIVKNIQVELGLDEHTSLYLFDDFLKNWDKLKSKLKLAIENLDYNEIGSIAHQIKGSAGSLKLIQVYKDAKNLEEVGKKVRDKCSTKRYFQLLEELDKKLLGE